MDDIEQKFLALRSPKSFKDAAVDPIQDYLTSPLNWSLEFNRLEIEIIELWHDCNVSMAHRSYFFLLFRGDQKDCLYMEVELRRLKYIRETFTNNTKTIENGRTLTSMSRYISSHKAHYLYLKCIFVLTVWGCETKQLEVVEQGEVQAESADAEETEQRREREPVLEMGNWAEHEAQEASAGASSMVREQRHGACPRERLGCGEADGVR